MDHNYSGEITNIRDTFINSEIDYIKKLSQVPEFLELYAAYSEVPVDELSGRLTGLLEKMENGEIKQENEKSVELEMICCCLAIKDAVLKKQLVLTPSGEEKTEGRHI